MVEDYKVSLYTPDKIEKQIQALREFGEEAVVFSDYCHISPRGNCFILGAAISLDQPEDFALSLQRYVKSLVQALYVKCLAREFLFSSPPKESLPN